MRMSLGLFVLAVAVALSSCATAPKVEATKLEKANILPLSLNDHFQFRKVKLYFFDDKPMPPTQSEPVLFEQSWLTYGAVTWLDRQQRYGNYFSFFWRTSERADVTIRLEYRQAALANYVMAQERYYPAAHGSYQSDFKVIGDDYQEWGRVTSWRALLIVDGKIVALRQSFMWR